MDSLVEGAKLVGRVESFDEHVGLGEISFESDLNSESRIAFHCTNIGDGSRKIDVGTVVSFIVYYHPMGRFEAKDIQPQ